MNINEAMNVICYQHLYNQQYIEEAIKVILGRKQTSYDYEKIEFYNRINKSVQKAVDYWYYNIYLKDKINVWRRSEFFKQRAVRQENLETLQTGNF